MEGREVYCESNNKGLLCVVAVVKWLAEFDNIRVAGARTAAKRVRFVQVAKLHFSKDGSQLTHLEEYVQPMRDGSFNWPPAGLAVQCKDNASANASNGSSSSGSSGSSSSSSGTSDAQLWSMVR